MSELAKRAIKKSTNYSMKQRDHLGIAYIAENGDIFIGNSLHSIQKAFNKSEEKNERELTNDIALVEQLNKTKLD
jgi:hypothetical protein